MALVLMRHGATPYDSYPGGPSTSAELILGWSDPSLNAAGRKEAVKLARRVKDDHDIGWLMSSSLLRSLETARIVGAYIEAPVMSVHSLKPWNVGDLAGKRVTEVTPALKRLAEHETDPCPGGEPFHDFRVRLLRYTNSLLYQAYRLDRDLGAVTHSRCVDLIRAWQGRGCPVDYSIDVDAYNASYDDEIKPGDTYVIAPTRDGRCASEEQESAEA